VLKVVMNKQIIQLGDFTVWEKLLDSRDNKVLSNISNLDKNVINEKEYNMRCRIRQFEKCYIFYRYDKKGALL
jgi:hypothetical protein